jgi:hypothetical protein
MAIWAGGTTINSNELAMVFNRVYNKQAINIAKRRNALLYSIFGEDESGSIPLDAADKFNRDAVITGHKVEVRLVGTLPAPAYIADGSAELATVTLSSNYDSTAFGAAEFDLAHLQWTEPIPNHELYRFAGDEAKTASYLQEIFNRVMAGYEKKIGDDLNAQNAPARGAIGGWQYAVSDGVTSGESSFAVYGGVDRSDSANSNYRASVRVPSGGTLTLAGIRQAQDDVYIGGGTPRLGLCEQTVYELVQSKIESFTEIIQDNSGWTKFGGTFFSYAGTKFVLDQRSNAGVLGILDPSSFVFIYKNQGLTGPNAILPDPSRAAAHVMPTEVWCQLVCTKPNSNAKITGITS